MAASIRSENAGIRILDMRNSDASSAAEFDLNLLRFLHALTDTASVTRAGEALGMSQPAASRATARLRKHFADPLLVRTPGGYVLTPVAQALVPSIRRALSAAREVFDSTAFDPASSTRRIRVASTDYGMSAVLLQTLPLLVREAPSMSLQVNPWTDETIAGLQRGQLDFALYADEPIPPDFHYRSLFSDGYTLVCRSGHPLARTKRRSAVDLLSAAAEYPQYAPRYPFGRTHVTDNIYRRLGLPGPRLLLEAPYFHAGASAARLGDLVAVLPARAARLWAPDKGLLVLALDEPRLTFEYRVIWHERAHRDKGLHWLRELMIRAIRG